MPAPKSGETVVVDPAAELPESEIDRLDPDPKLVHLPKNGADLRLQRMGTRQLFRLLRVLTHGAGSALVQEIMSFQPGEGEDAAREFGLRMMTLILLAVPDAEQPFMDFLGSMFLPDGYVDKPNRELTEVQIGLNEELLKAYNADMGNPDPEDSLVMIEAIITQESKDILGLGNRIALLARTFRPAKPGKK